MVADLWAGTALIGGRQSPWQPDTLVNLFSVGKGLIATLTARQVGAGLLNLDKAVAAYWPQFAAAGKESVTVRQLLAHQAGLPAQRGPLPAGTMLDWAAMTSALAAEPPWWPPGTAHGYHVNTFGPRGGALLCGTGRWRHRGRGAGSGLWRTRRGSV